jgi:hypothetical protein
LEIAAEGIRVFAGNEHRVLDYAHLDELWKRRSFVKAGKNKNTVINKIWRQSGLEADHKDESYYWAVVCDRERREEASAEEDESFRREERAAGFESDSRVRRIVGQHAMERARKELVSRGFSSFEDPSRDHCYDYTCEHLGNRYYVEVKGTQGSGASVILTNNEVEHAKKHQRNSIAVIVHGIEVDSKAPRINA